PLAMFDRRPYTRTPDEWYGSEKSIRCLRSSVMKIEATIISTFPVAVAAIRLPNGICDNFGVRPSDAAKRWASSMSQPQRTPLRQRFGVGQRRVHLAGHDPERQVRRGLVLQDRRIRVVLRGQGVVHRAEQHADTLVFQICRRGHLGVGTLAPGPPAPTRRRLI